ncbi:hypothetical protein RvY_07428 [Ramazzottius varieornatus]|uniref:PIN domain-containing protein n=1 Tax=Ramazzottius varieornatus TaxID=947166 RepID=A0A1D1VAK3_RAMVA|nr:hypothetical protein RvY_07428 [Ramazzottius varieornatus]
MAYNYSTHPIPLQGGHQAAVPSSYEPERSAQDHSGWHKDHFPDRRDHPAYPNPPRDGPSRYPPFAGTPGILQQHGNMSGGRQIISQQVCQVQQVVTSNEASSTAYHSPPPSIHFGCPSAYPERPSQHPENFHRSHEAAYRVNQSCSARRKSSDGPSSSKRRNSGRRWEGLKKTVPKPGEKKKQYSKADDSSAQKQEAKEPKKNEEKVGSSVNNQAGKDQKASSSSSVPASSSAGDTASSAGEPMEVDLGVTYLHTFRISHAQEQAVDLPNDTADLELNLPDLAQIKCVIVFDTSVLLSDEGEKFFELMKGLEDAQYLHYILFQMPYTVLEELDHLKDGKDEKFARRSRNASKFWCERVGTRFTLQNAENNHRPARKVPLRKGDDRIVNCFVQLYDKLSPERLVCLVTNDNNMILKAVGMSGIGEKDRQKQIMDSKAFMKELQQMLKTELNFKTGNQCLVAAESVPDQEQEDSPMEGVTTVDPQTVAQSIIVLHQLYQCLDRALLSLLKVFLEKRLTLVYNGEVWRDMFDKPNHWLTPERIVAFLLKHWHPFTAGAELLERQKTQFESLIPAVKRGPGESNEQAIHNRIVSRAGAVHSLVVIIEKYEEKEVRTQYQDRLNFTKGKLGLWSDLYYNYRTGKAGAAEKLERETSTFLSPVT